jgi:hypothetical protein
MVRRSSLALPPTARCLLVVVRGAALGTALRRFLGRDYASAALARDGASAEAVLRDPSHGPFDVVCSRDLGASPGEGVRLVQRWQRLGLLPGVVVLIGGEPDQARLVGVEHLPDPIDPAGLRTTLLVGRGAAPPLGAQRRHAS